MMLNKETTIDATQTAEIETPKTETNPVELAKQKIETIRQKILAGDTSLTATDLADARAQLEFAELRESAAREREEKRVKADRREQLAVLERRLSTISKVDSFEKSLLEIEKPLDRYLSKLSRRNEEIAAIHQELIDGGFIVGYVNFAPVDGVVVEAPTASSPVVIGDAQAQAFDPRAKVEQFVAEILQRHFPLRGR